MLRLTSILAAAVIALSACSQESNPEPDQETGQDSSQEPDQEPSDDTGGGTPPTMPEVTLSVSETDGELEVVFEATVEIETDGAWERTGDGPDSGELTEDEIVRIAELVQAPDFPQDPDNDVACPEVVPDYYWSLDVGEDKVTNGSGGCSFSGSADEIVGIIQEAADVGPTL